MFGDQVETIYFAKFDLPGTNRLIMDQTGQVLFLAQETESLLMFLLISCPVEDGSGQQYQNVTAFC